MSRFPAVFAAASFVAALGVLGCMSDPASSSDGGSGGGSATGGRSGSGGGSSSGGRSGSGGSGTVTYTKDVQPIFAAKCVPCHSTDGAGAHNIATTYADAFKPVQSLDAPAGCFLDGFDRMMPKKMGECALAAIMEGWMPMAAGCFNTPRPPACVSLAEQDVIAAWVAAGMPE